MENCISDISKLHAPKALPPRLEAGLLEGLYELHQHNPSTDDCGKSRVDALLGSNISLIRATGGDYLGDVMQSIRRDEPGTAEAMSRAVIQPNGNIDFPDVGQIFYPTQKAY